MGEWEGGCWEGLCEELNRFGESELPIFTLQMTPTKVTAFYGSLFVGNFGDAYCYCNSMGQQLGFINV